MTDFPEHATIGQLYTPAMDIADQGEAIAYFDKVVAHSMVRAPHRSRPATEEMVRSNEMAKASKR